MSVNIMHTLLESGSFITREYKQVIAWILTTAAAADYSLLESPPLCPNRSGIRTFFSL
jgi:hypothetical protein